MLILHFQVTFTIQEELDHLRSPVTMQTVSLLHDLLLCSLRHIMVVSDEISYRILPVNVRTTFNNLPRPSPKEAQGIPAHEDTVNYKSGLEQSLGVRRLSWVVTLTFVSLKLTPWTALTTSGHDLPAHGD